MITDRRMGQAGAAGRYAARALVKLGLLAVAALPAGAAPEEFYLRAVHTNRVFGPFPFEQGATVTVGKVAFALERRPAEIVTDDDLSPQAAKAATTAAAAWLALIDGDAFGEAWERASDYLKTALGRDEFVKSLEAVRTTLGRLQSRVPGSMQYTESLPSAPDGRYVIIQYNVAMARKRRAAETVIVVCDADGEWRISGYYVR